MMTIVFRSHLVLQQQQKSGLVLSTDRSNGGVLLNGESKIQMTLLTAPTFVTTESFARAKQK
jgi:hypothetical protein